MRPQKNLCFLFTEEDKLPWSWDVEYGFLNAKSAYYDILTNMWGNHKIRWYSKLWNLKFPLKLFLFLLVSFKEKNSHRGEFAN